MECYSDEDSLFSDNEDNCPPLPQLLKSCDQTSCDHHPKYKPSVSVLEDNYHFTRLPSCTEIEDDGWETADSQDNDTGTKRGEYIP